jgi:hypothetical protein
MPTITPGRNCSKLRQAGGTAIMTDPPTLRRQVVCASMFSLFICCYILSITKNNPQSNENFSSIEENLKKDAADLSF